MNQPLDVQQAIRAAMLAEKDAMDFYRQVARKIPDPEAACRFAQLAREERQHAYTFFNIYRGGDIPSFEAFIAEPPDPASDWWTALRRLETEGFDERAALRLAVERERALEKSLRETAEIIENPQVRFIYLANANSTHNHCQGLEQACAERYGEPC